MPSSVPEWSSGFGRFGGRQFWITFVSLPARRDALQRFAAAHPDRVGGFFYADDAETFEEMTVGSGTFHLWITDEERLGGEAAPAIQRFLSANPQCRTLMVDATDNGVETLLRGWLEPES